MIHEETTVFIGFMTEIDKERGREFDVWIDVKEIVNPQRFRAICSSLFIFSYHGSLLLIVFCREITRYC